MSRSPLYDLAHPMLALSGLAYLVSAAVGLPGEFDPTPVSNSELILDGSYVPWALLVTAASLLLAVGVAAIAEHRGPDGRGIGRAGLVLGLVAAVIGFFLNANHAFVQPAIAAAAPDLMNDPPGGLLAVGALGGFVVTVIGLVTFGVSAFRRRVLPRPAAVLIVVGVLAFVAGSVQDVLLGAGLLWAGLSGLRARTAVQVQPA